MNSIVQYIDDLPLKEGEKWLCNLMVHSGKTLMSRDWLIDNTNYKKPQLVPRLKNLKECGMISKKKEGEEIVWFISDPRLKRQMHALQKPQTEAV